MPRYSQQEHPFRVETPLGEDVLLLDGFTGEETVSRPFHFTLQLLSEDDAIDPQALLREAVTLFVRLPDGSERPIQGKVSRFRQLQKAEDLTEYQAEIVPWLWFLSLSTDCRVFQNKTVLEIIEEVFGAYGDADFDIKCLEDYQPREYCVQYRETDLNFVSRLMEEEGIYYYFEHSESGHTLILGDSPDTIPDSLQSTARVKPESGGWQEEEPDVVTEFQREHSVHTAAVTLTDYDYLQPSLDLRSTVTSDNFEEIYDFPGQYTEVPQGERYADLLLKQRSVLKELVTGAGTCRGFQSGHQFELKDHYRTDANQRYLLLSIAHSAQGAGYRSRDSAVDYRNDFRCIPIAVPYHPPRSSPKPSVQGSQTAVVVGPSGEEIYTDEHGRVKIQFHWDRQGEKDENSSCWVRVSQPWAGKAWGAVAIPRIGQEVLVDFLEGDPDRPIITGRVYNAEQIPPYSLPANKTQTGIKSRSSKEGNSSTFNEILLEDKKGSEQITIRAQKDMSTTVLNNESLSVGADRSISVDKTHTETIKKDTKITVTEGKLETKVETGSVLLQAQSNSVKVEADTQAHLLGHGDVLVERDGSHRMEVKSGEVVLTCGGSSIEMTDSDITLSSPQISLEADIKVEIKVGASTVKVSPAGVEVSGPTAKVEGTGMTEIKGGVVRINS
jgi:type VI secretion system secreted protein VgrG